MDFRHFMPLRKWEYTMIFSRDIGIDLGTSNTLVADKKGHIIIKEPSVVAFWQPATRLKK